MVLAGLWSGLLLLSHRKHQHYHTSYHLIFSLLGLPYILMAQTKSFYHPPIQSPGFISQEDWLIYYDLPKPSFTPGICRSSKPHNSQSEAANKISDLLCSSSAMVLWKCPADPLLSYPLPPLLHHSHSSVGLTHLWEVPGVTWWPRSSAVMLIYIWQVLITKQMRRMQNLWSEPLCHSSPRRCEVPCSAEWDVTAPSKMLSNTSLRFYCQCFPWSACQSLRSVLRSVWTRKQRSKEWEYHIVPLWSNRFYVPMEWLMFAHPHIVWNWSQSLPSGLCTSSSTHRWQSQQVFPPYTMAAAVTVYKPALTPEQKDIAECFESEKNMPFPGCYESSWRYLSLPIAFVHFDLWLRMSESKNPLKNEIKRNWNS